MDSEVCCRFSHPAACLFPCQLPLWLLWTSRTALQEERAGVGGGTSHTGFGALPVTVPVRLRHRKGSSRLLLTVSHIHSTECYPVISMFIPTIHATTQQRGPWGQLTFREPMAARGCSHKGFIYGRGIQFLRSPWRLTQLDNTGLRTTQVQWAQALGRLENWYLWSKIHMLFSS